MTQLYFAEAPRLFLRNRMFLQKPMALFACFILFSEEKHHRALVYPFRPSDAQGFAPLEMMPSHHFPALAMMDLAGLADLVEVCRGMLDLEGNHLAERGGMALILRSKLPHDGVIPHTRHVEQ